MNFYKRYPGDYMRDTSHLSLAQHGAYTILLDHYYSTGKPLPGSLESLCRICRAMSSDEQAAVTAVAEAFFPLADDGCRHNRRSDEEIAVWHSKAEANRESGKKGGRPKKEPTENPLETQTVSSSVSGMKPTENPLQNPESRIQNPEPEGEARVARASPQRSRRAPKEFSLTPDMRTWGQAHTPRARLDSEHAVFMDHEFKDPHSDWLAVWRNWMRRADKNAVGPRVLNGKPHRDPYAHSE
jgi:uncharacterized protein YdaU (DUF1376 family)